MENIVFLLKGDYLTKKLVILFIFIFNIGLSIYSFLLIPNIGLKMVTPLKNDVLVSIDSIDEFYSIQNGYIYFGKDSCKQCRLFKPILENTIKNQTNTVYYFDTDFFRKELHVSESELQNIFDTYEIVGVPIVIQIKESHLESVIYFADMENSDAENVQTQLENYFLEGEMLSTDGQFKTQYIPQYTTYIILFSAALLLSLSLFFFRKKAYYNTLTFLGTINSVSSLLPLIITTRSAMRYLDFHHLSGSSLAFFLIIGICILNIMNVGIAIFSKNRGMNI